LVGVAAAETTPVALGHRAATEQPELQAAAVVVAAMVPAEGFAALAVLALSAFGSTHNARND
jgi:hypothetical protein